MSPSEADYGGPTARFYDAGYAALEALGPDIDFYRSLALEVGGPVLELGCGTGRVLLPLAEAGLECTGVDASESMLSALRAKPGGDALRLERVRMQDFDLGAHYRMIFSAFRAFQHLLTVDDQLRCLERVRAHLEPGGVFTFDVFNPRFESLTHGEAPEAEDLRFPFEGDEVVRYATVRRVPAEQQIHVRFRYERSRDGRVVETQHAELSMRWFLRFELEHLLIRAGFVDVQVFGDWERGAVVDGSPALIALARQPRENASPAGER